MRINLLPREERPLKQTEVRWEFIAGLIATLLFLSVIGVTIGLCNRLEAITVEAQAWQATFTQTGTRRECNSGKN